MKLKYILLIALITTIVVSIIPTHVKTYVDSGCPDDCYRDVIGYGFPIPIISNARDWPIGSINDILYSPPIAFFALILFFINALMIAGAIKILEIILNFVYEKVKKASFLKSA